MNDKNTLKNYDTGLLFLCDGESEKLFLTRCMVNAILEKEHSLLRTDPNRILGELAGYSSKERKQFFENLDQYDLLVLDDLGLERGFEFAQEQIFAVVDTWYRSNRPMIVTTSLTLEEMKHPDSSVCAKIYSRILERCIPIEIKIKNSHSWSDERWSNAYGRT